MAFQSNTQNQASKPTRQDDSWKADGFLNLLLSSSGRKYGYIPLRASKPHEAALLKLLNDTTLVPAAELPEGVSADAAMTRAELTEFKIASKLIIEFRAADESEAHIDAELAALFGTAIPQPETAQDQPTGEPGKEKALGYLNFYLPVTGGGKSKLGDGMAFRGSVAIERGLYTACKLDPSHVEKLRASTAVDYRSAEPRRSAPLYDI